MKLFLNPGHYNDAQEYKAFKTYLESRGHVVIKTVSPLRYTNENILLPMYEAFCVTYY